MASTGQGRAGGDHGGTADRGRPGSPRGISDGLLVGGIALLLGLTTLVWTATGLSGWFAHGHWPDEVRFIRTPMAMRHLIENPHDLQTAWPDTPKAQLSGYGLFWGIFISELMVLFVLAVFAFGTIARYRIVRADRRAAQRAARERAARDREAPATGMSGAGRTGTGVEAAPAAAAVPGATDRPHPGEQPPEATGAAAPLAADTAQRAQTPQTEQAVQTKAATAPPPEAPSVPGAAPAPAPPRPAAAAPAPTAPPPPAAPQEGAAPFEPAPDHSRVLYGAERGDTAARAVLEAEGPVLVVTSDPVLWADTKDARAKLGPTYVFDPAHRLDTPARLRWNPATGCEARDVAAARSAALLAPVRPVHAIDRPMAEAAETMLRCWLHAAAVDGRPFRQVHRWAQGNSAHEPVRILRTHPKAAGGAAGELEATLTAHPERRDVAQELTARALGALSSIHIRDACNPGRSDAFALESFFNEGGTLYLVGESIEDPRTHPGAMPLLTALASSVVEHGRRMAERSSSGRLDPPMALVLDDVAAVAPLPALPELLTQGAAQGLPTLALMRSQEQARTRWPHATFAD